MTQHGLAARIAALRAEIREDPDMAPLDRIAVALYDPRTDLLKTFIHASDGPNPLDHAAAPLSSLPALQALADSGDSRTINDLVELARDGHDYVARLVSFGYRASHTRPILGRDGPHGFLFLNATRRDFFTPTLLRRLKPYADLIAQIVLRELDALAAMRNMVRVLLQIAAVRDGETGAHLARMARYSRLIAATLAPHHGLSDEFVEYVFQFAPVHDVGKIGVPDHVLLKPGPLDPEELALMREHVTHGEEIVTLAVGEHAFISGLHLRMLRNIVACHHEKLDGSGYPRGLKDGEIPLEARIVAVADVFDALTSRRPYKEAWSNQRALDTLADEAAAGKLDAACVAALAARPEEIAAIQARFSETLIG